MSASETTRSTPASLTAPDQRELKNTLHFHQSEPLWKRAPTRDGNGQLYHDFMMFIPGLRDFELAHKQAIVSKMEQALKCYEKEVVLADLNLKLNVLWVTIQPRSGLSTEIAALLHHLIPEAKLVAQHST